MSSVSLRLVLVGIACVGPGRLILPILDSAPLLSDAALITQPISASYFTMIFGLIIAVGVIDGYFNQAADQDAKVHYAAGSYVVATGGAIIGFLWGIWPFTDDDLGTRVSQIFAIAFDFLIFYFLAHIAGNDLWEKRQGRASRLHPSS